MRKDKNSEAEVFEQEVAQIIQEATQYWKPFLESLGLRVSVYIAYGATAAHKSTLDFQAITEGGQTVWVDSLILYMDGERWADLEEVKRFLISAMQKALEVLYRLSTSSR